MKFLESKKLSLFCFIINCIFAYAALSRGDIIWFVTSTILACICFYNYKTAE